jgi:hypothetical protein
VVAALLALPNKRDREGNQLLPRFANNVENLSLDSSYLHLRSELGVVSKPPYTHTWY